MNTKDYKLILEIKNNNPLAFEEFLINHKKIIDICCYQLNIDKDFILDKIFDLILLNTSVLQNIKNIDTYIFSCVKKLKYNNILKDKRECEKISRINKKELFSEFKSDIYFYDLIKIVDAELSELLKLRYLDDLTIRQIADIKNMSKSTVDYKLKKACNKIYYKLSK